MRGLHSLPVVLGVLAGLVVAGSARAQKSYDDHELTDRLYFRIGGFQQTEIRTTLRIDAMTSQGAIAAGAVVALESLFKVDDSVSTVRFDGWYRLGKKSRLNWTVWQTDRDGINTYEGDPLTVGDILIESGQMVRIRDKTTLYAFSYTYSFLNTEKYEAWLGGGFNFQRVETTIESTLGGSTFEQMEDAKATVPIPVLSFGGRWNLSRRWRTLITQELFGIDIGDYSGRLSNTRILAEVNLTRNFGLGAGLERYNFQVDAEADDFTGSFDTGYTGLSVYLKGQL
ncbi:MAG TPA: hypothetical protein VD788_15650 [Candidatus Polarisedimenticolaceae bacterium]|nr:hypothetical protein [Candidatus Polarisedimenticolaceae bacterium]